MDTRSKKRKQVISFAVFFLSVSLLLTNGAVVLRRLLSMGNWKEYGISQLMEQDYQNTWDFRQFIQGRLSDFIAMASGGRIGTYFDVSSDYWEAVSGVRFSRNVEESVNFKNAVLEEETYEAVDRGDSTQSDADKSSDEREKELKEQNEANAKAYHESIRENKNMLYRISNAGRELYSNMDGIDWDKSNKTLPEGYNFLLIFNQGRASIVKDGVELDVYGDGYYRGGAQWFVPGYKNFAVYPASDTADGIYSRQKMNEIEVIILAAQEPVPYSYVKYGQGGYQLPENRLYGIAEEVKYDYHTMRLSILGLFAGILLSAVSILLRRDKRAADENIARFTGRIWFEAKCFILLILFLWLCSTAGSSMYADAVWVQQGTADTAVSDYRMLQSEAEYTTEQEADAVTDNVWQQLPAVSFYRFADILSDHMDVAVSFFWVIYLFINDIRRNRGHFFDGIIARIWRSIKADGLKQPFAVQQMRSYAFLALLSIAAVLAMVFLSVFYCSRFMNLMELIFGMCLVSVLFLVIVSQCLIRAKGNAAELDQLADYILAVQGGDFTPKDNLAEGSSLRQLFDGLGRIRQGMETAVDQQLKSERMKVELVANVSHDLKTPLTSIISYIAFLKQEDGLPEHVRDYIRILDEKAGRLNAIVQDVFAVSKAASGQLPIELEELDFGKLLRQTLADMQEQIQAAPVTIKTDIAPEEVRITADGNRMYRVFQNLIQNALKYSLEGSRIFIDLKQDGEYAAASIKNISRKELLKGTDFTERFLRGDESRTDGGAGLGLSIAKSFTEACGGQFHLEAQADLFSVTVKFKQSKQSGSKSQSS